MYFLKENGIRYISSKRLVYIFYKENITIYNVIGSNIDINHGPSKYILFMISTKEQYK